MRRNGGTALEFGLVFPSLTIILFLGLNWGWFLFNQLTVSIASQRGARMAAGASSARKPTHLAEKAAREWMHDYGLRGDEAVITVFITPDGNSKAIMVHTWLPFQPLLGMGWVPDHVEANVSGVYYGWMLDPV